MLSSSNCQTLSSRLSKFLPLILLLASVAFAQATEFANHDNTIAPETWVLGIFAMLTGFLFCFFGTSTWRFTVFAAGFYAFGLLSVTIAVNILDGGANLSMTDEKRSTILLIVFVVAGIIGGFLATCFYKLGVMLVGGVGGAFFALWILSFSPTGFFAAGAARIVFIFVFGIIGALLSFRFEKHAVIIGSSFAGAYIFMFGVDCFARSGFREAGARIISAIDKRQTITAAEYSNPGAVYGMLASMVVMAIAGTVIQYKRYTSFGGK